MKQYILIFFLLNLPAALRAQDKTDVANEGLKGSVRTMTVKGFSAETVNGRTKKSFPIATTIKRFNQQGMLTETVSGTGYDTVVVKGTNIRGARIAYKYDEQNNLVSSMSYFTDGRLSDSSTHEVDKMGNRTFWKIYRGNGSIAWEYVREYDNVGNLLEINDYHNGKLETRHTYRYNDNSKCIKESDYDEYGRLKVEQVMKYDERGNRTEMTEYNTADGSEVRHYYKYNAAGKCTEEYEYATATAKKYKKTLNFYDQQNNLIEIKQYAENGVQLYEGRFDSYGNHLADIAYNPDGSLHDQITAEYKYDSRGNEIEEMLHYTDGASAASISKYEYDMANNWIKKTVFEDGEATRLIEREIEYY